MGKIPEHVAELKSKDVGKRRYAVNALGKHGEEAIPHLVTALKDEDTYVRRSVVEALGELGHVNAIPALAEALKDENAGVRWKAVEALGKMGSPALKELIKAHENASEEDRGLIEHEINKIEEGEDA